MKKHKKRDLTDQSKSRVHYNILEKKMQIGEFMKTIKTILILMIISILFVGFLFIASSRFEKIDKGEMTLVSQNLK